MLLPDHAIDRLAVARGVRTLYRNVSLIAPPGERIGLIGANGSGKSTLFAAILASCAVDGGTIEAPPPGPHRARGAGHRGTDETAIDYVLGGHSPLTAARSELADA